MIDYASYTQEELEDARRSIDESSYPERAAQLNAEIKRRREGGKRVSTEPKKPLVAKSPRNRSRALPFIGKLPKGEQVTIIFCLLVVTLSSLIVLNLFLHTRTDSLIPTISILVQSVVLIFTLLGARGAAWVIRIWASVAILGGIAYWVSIAAALFAWVIYPEGGPLPQRITDFSIGLAVGRTLTVILGVLFVVWSSDIAASRRGSKRVATPDN